MLVLSYLEEERGKFEYYSNLFQANEYLTAASVPGLNISFIYYWL